MPYKNMEDKRAWENRPENRIKRLTRAGKYYQKHKEKISDYNRRYYEENKMATREAHRINNIARRERIADGNSKVKPIRVTYPDCAMQDYFTMSQYRRYESCLCDSRVEKRVGDKWVLIATQEALI